MVLRSIAAVVGIGCGVAVLASFAGVGTFGPNGGGDLSELSLDWWLLFGAVAVAVAAGVYLLIVEAVEGTRRQRRGDRGHETAGGSAVPPRTGYVLPPRQHMKDVLANDEQLQRDEGVDARWPGDDESAADRS